MSEKITDAELATLITHFEEMGQAKNLYGRNALAALAELQERRASSLVAGRDAVQRELDDVKSSGAALAGYYESAKADAAFLRGVLQELSPRLIGDGEQDLKDIVDAALSKHPTDAAAAGRDAVIDQAVKAARDASEAFLTDRTTYVMMGPAGLVGSIVNAILRMKETPNGN